MYATDMLSSLYESAVWEKITGRESISTISILNKAKTDGIEVLMLLAMDMARTASEDYYAYWESGNEQEIEQMAEKALWLGLVLAATGAWAYCMDEMNQMGAGGGGTGGGSTILYEIDSLIQWIKYNVTGYDLELINL